MFMGGPLKIKDDCALGGVNVLVLQPYTWLCRHISPDESKGTYFQVGVNTVLV